VAPTRGSEDRPQQPGELGGVEPRQRVIRADDLAASFGACPLPPGSEDDRGSWSCRRLASFALP
jgi:hypothetical protein